MLTRMLSETVLCEYKNAGRGIIPLIEAWWSSEKMKLHRFLPLSLCLIVLLTEIAHGFSQLKRRSLSDEEVLKPLDTNYALLEITNLHTNETMKSSLRLSLIGVKIIQKVLLPTKHGAQFSNETELKLSDRSRVTFRQKQNPLGNDRKFSEYRFKWTKSTATPEVCFHYAFNNASWWVWSRATKFCS